MSPHVTCAWSPSSRRDSVTRRNATGHTAIAPTRRRHLRTYRKIQHGSNCLPQALALPTLFRDVFRQTENACGGNTYVLLETTRYSHTPDGTTGRYAAATFGQTAEPPFGQRQIILPGDRGMSERPENYTAALHCGLSFQFICMSQ